MVRWDSPLFTIAWDDNGAPLEDIWKAVTAGNVQVANAGTAVVRSPTSRYRLLMTYHPGTSSTRRRTADP